MHPFQEVRLTLMSLMFNRPNEGLYDSIDYIKDNIILYWLFSLHITLPFLTIR